MDSDGVYMVKRMFSELADGFKLMKRGKTLDLCDISG